MSGKRGRRGHRPVLAVMAALSVVLVLGAGCGDDEEDSAATELGGDVGETGAEGFTPEITLSDLLEKPKVYNGQIVTVSGEAGEVLLPGDAAFTIGERLSGEPESQLFVLPESDALLPSIEEGNVYQVTGLVDVLPLDVADEGNLLFTEQGEDATFLDDLEGAPAIAADSVDTNVQEEQTGD